MKEPEQRGYRRVEAGMRTGEHTRFTLRWSLVFGIGAGVVMLATSPPFASDTVRPWLMLAFGSVCHQLPARSPSLAGHPLAVCHRCYGIYWGLPAAALALLLLRRRAPRLMDWTREHAGLMLLAALVPLALDWGLDAVGVVPNSPFTRTATGLVFGLAAGWLFARSVVLGNRA